MSVGEGGCLGCCRGEEEEREKEGEKEGEGGDRRREEEECQSEHTDQSLRCCM